MSLEHIDDEQQPLISGDLDEAPSAWKKSVQLLRHQILLVLFAAIVLVLALKITILLLALDNSRNGFEAVTPRLDITPNVLRSWAMYSPYYPAGRYPTVPPGCALNQVNVIQRHAARFPTSGRGKRIQSAVSKLQSSRSYNDPKLVFLHDYVYDLGYDDLVPFGVAQAFDAGQLDFVRYKRLFSSDNIPFVRASGSKRVVHTATNWTAGFAAVSPFRPVLSIIFDESLNNTLEDHMCPNAGDADSYTDAWQTVFAAPIRDRLNNAAPGADLTLDDIPSLISLCAFHTVALAKPSPWCSLFSQADFDAFEYYGDLNKFYGTGPGQPLGRVQGVGYVNELLARLTGSPVKDETQTNRTLDSSPETFPLNRSFYIDFSHDNLIIAALAAVGLFVLKEPLNPINPDPTRSYIVSRIVPFSGKLVTERLTCNGRLFVRMIVDDQLQALPFCDSDTNGLCSLDAFVESQAYVRNNGDGDFEKCFKASR